VVEKTAAFRQCARRTPDAGASGFERGAAVYPVEADGELFDLMARYGLLAAGHETNRRAVAIALGKLPRLALAALKQQVDPHP